ncbi:hypothetical protein OG604_43350 [Streptomyces sp. NBC_01231]|nr:hypothetical protein OG604_43350 [Streptomyces sp. NBC_01231]
MGSVRQMLCRGWSRLRVPCLAHGGFIGGRGGFQRVGEQGAGQVGCGDTGSVDGGGECFQRRAAAGDGGLLAAVEGGEAVHGVLDQLVWR